MLFFLSLILYSIINKKDKLKILHEWCTKIMYVQQIIRLMGRRFTLEYKVFQTLVYIINFWDVFTNDGKQDFEKKLIYKIIPELFIGFQKTPWNVVLSTYSLFHFHTQKVWKKNPYLLWLMYYQQP